MKNSYLVMRWVYNDKKYPYIDVIGVFSSEEKAKAECLTELYFWGAFEVDKAFHRKGMPWMTEEPYPKAE